MKIKSFYLDGIKQETEVKDFAETEEENRFINIYPVEKSEIIGFGGAFTDSSAFNYYSAPEGEKRKILEYLFGDGGLKYNLCRLCIGSSDFATEEYCYVQENDESLSTFNIERDKKYIIPFVKDALKFSGNKIKLFASPWSPPAFMKDNGRRIDGGKLKKEYYGIYAEYVARFIEAYSEEGIEIFAVTLQNEPKARQTWESCFYTAREEADFAKTLKKVFAERGITAKILCWDHNKERLFERADTVYSLCGDIVDGAGFHWYSGEHFGAIAAVKAKYPEKLALATEFCVSSGIDEVNTGYAEEILGDLSNGADGIVEWNLILDDEGGPFHNRKSGCAAPLRYDRSENRVGKSDIYNKIYAFSHFIERGARSLYTSSFDEKIKTCAVKNPNGDIILTVLNSCSKGAADIYVNGKATSVFLKAGGLYTFVIGE